MSRAASRPPGRRIALFVALPIFGSLAPLLVLPLISRVAGVEGWAVIIAAQASGTFTATAIMFGKTVTGPADVAQVETEGDALRIYALSVPTRGMNALAALPVGLAVTLAFAQGRYLLDAVFMFLAFASSGFSFSWFAVGRGKAGWIVRYELVPRIIALCLGAALVASTRVTLFYPGLLLVGNVLGLLMFHRQLTGAVHERTCMGFRSWVGQLRTEWHAGVLSLAGSIFSSAPVPLVTALSASTTAGSFASADKMYRFGLLGIIGLANGVQGWVLAPRPGRGRRRVWALYGHLAVGVAGLGLMGAVGRPASALLFGSHVAASPTFLWAYGVGFLALSLATPLTRNTLIPAGRTASVLVASCFGAGLGLVAMVTLSRAWGAGGVAWGFAIGEVANL